MFYVYCSTWNYSSSGAVTQGLCLLLHLENASNWSSNTSSLGETPVSSGDKSLAKLALNLKFMEETMTISEQDLLWLKVYLPFMYHVQKLHLLLTKYSIADIAGFSRNMLKALKFSEALIKRVLQPDTAELEQILHWLEDGNHHLLTLESPSYPHYLRHIATAPPVLFVQGDASLLSQPQIAIVGSRHASHSAIDIAFEMAEQLSPDYVITSGMALGIDGSAHLGALAAKRPTIAVLGSGFHNLYPRRHVTLEIGRAHV